MIDTVIRPVIVSGRLDGVEYDVIDWHESTDHRGVWTFCKRRIKSPLEIRIERRIEEARMAEVGKPTHPGFYWYKGDLIASRWEPVSVYRESKHVLRAEFIGIEGDDSIDTLRGEWGPEIVHVD